MYAVWPERYELTKWFLPLARGTVVDVGAHIGKYVVYACRNDGVERVIGIEPVIYNYIVLRMNVKLNGCEDKAELVRKAVGSSKGIANFYIPIKDGRLDFTRASLEKPESNTNSLK